MIVLVMRRRAFFLMVTAVGILITPPIGSTPAKASTNYQENCNYELVWRQQSTDAFAVVYPPEYTNLAQLVLSAVRGELDETYSKYAEAFGVSLDAPITIRVYPSVEDYDCLNALAPELGAGAAHAHAGNSEVALFGEAINANLDAWRETANNSLKYELAVLFAEKLTDGNAPQGLLYGIGGYAENPEETFLGLYEAAGQPSSATASWQIVWEGDYDANDPAMKLQATSTVAYLIGTFGWGNFVAFLNQLAVLGEYRQALGAAYGLGVQEIQAQWRAYYSNYLDGGWHSNVFYRVDLSVDETLIEAGAYEDAAARLEGVLPMMTIFGTAEEVGEAENLLAEAKLGTEAGAIANLAREAILQGRYEESIGLANQAMERFNQIGNTSRNPELEAYAQIGREVLNLRAEVEAIREGKNPFNPTTTRRLWEIAQRLSVLGDEEGLSRVAEAFNLVNSDQRMVLEAISIAGVLVCVILIGRRILAYRQPKPPEAELL